MPVKKVVKRSAKKAVKKKPKSQIDIVLPEDVSAVSNRLEDYSFLIYGERKIGKTELFSQFDRALFFMFDPLNVGLAIRQMYMPNWQTFKKALEVLKKRLEIDPSYCKFVVIDTGFMAYERCYQYMVKEVLGIENAQNNDRGLAWKEISREFMEAHDIIFQLGLGLGVTAHAEITEVRRRDGSSYNKLTTQLGAQAFKFYNGALDIVAFYQYNKKNKRELTIRGNSLIEAGVRIQHDTHFKYADGTPIENISMGTSAKQSYRNLMLAFNNQLTKEGIKAKKKVPRKKTQF